MANSYEMLKTSHFSRLIYIKTLKLACKHHTTKRRIKDLTVDICLDADRLDLNRVNIKPDPKRMATEAGARFAQMGEAELESRKDIYMNS